MESIHLDSSSFSVEGEYENTLMEETNVEVDSEEGEKLNLPQPIQITYGYSRDKRPDLKQFMVDLICSSEKLAQSLARIRVKVFFLNLSFWRVG